ncbi:hypothetical protein ACFYPT_37215 [Streptomyces sp. NPDC005529]|uniref:hypothetical protein n=1 Tax=unclassified Streptomyces TaxID=2593676 RepID=UPI0033BEB858
MREPEAAVRFRALLSPGQAEGSDTGGWTVRQLIVPVSSLTLTSTRGRGAVPVAARWDTGERLYAAVTWARSSTAAGTDADTEAAAVPLVEEAWVGCCDGSAGLLLTWPAAFSMSSARRSPGTLLFPDRLPIG